MGGVGKGWVGLRQWVGLGKGGAGKNSGRDLEVWYVQT